MVDIIKVLLIEGKEKNFDHLVKETVADVLKAEVHDVGQALAQLCKEGILSGPVRHPVEYDQEKTGTKPKGGFSNPLKKLPEHVRVGDMMVEWDGKSWVQEVKYPKFGHRNPYIKPAHRNKNSKLPKRDIAKISRKFPKTEPSGWDGLAYKIEKESKAFAEMISSVNNWPSNAPKKICKRCGQPQPLGFRNHDMWSCNDQIVNSVHDS